MHSASQSHSRIKQEFYISHFHTVVVAEYFRGGFSNAGMPAVYSAMCDCAQHLERQSYLIFLCEIKSIFS